jgi:ribosome-binding protein aMBF1 (putative translation factor)
MPNNGSSRERRVRRPRLVPRDWVADAGTWPDGPLVDDCPMLVKYARVIASAVVAECRRRAWSAGDLADRANLSGKAVRDALEGRAVPDFEVVVGMEVALRMSLWPGADLS